MKKKQIEVSFSIEIYKMFISDLMLEFMLLAKYLNEPIKKEDFNLIDRAYLFDFSILKPRKKISKKEYHEMLIIYSCCWMMAYTESLEKKYESTENKILLGVVLFYAFIMGHDTKVDPEDLQSHQKRIYKIFKAYDKDGIFSYFRILAESSVKNEKKLGFTPVELLHYFMEFEALPYNPRHNK